VTDCDGDCVDVPEMLADWDGVALTDADWDGVAEIDGDTLDVPDWLGESVDDCVSLGVPEMLWLAEALCVGDCDTLAVCDSEGDCDCVCDCVWLGVADVERVWLTLAVGDWLRVEVPDADSL